MASTHAAIAATDRITEIGEILAAVLIRLMARKSSTFLRSNGESSVDCDAKQSGHFEPETRRNDPKILAYWCKAGQPCHADVLLEIANPQGDQAP